MTLRRLLALLTSATMLHLSVVAGDSACATHGAGGHHAASAVVGESTDHAAAMDGHVMPTVAVASVPKVNATPAATSAPPCEVPTQQHCCEAQVGCSVTGAVVSAHQVLASAVPSAPRIREALHDAPASFAPAPEPPPPKA